MNAALGVSLVLGFVLLSALNGVYLSAFLSKVDVFATLCLVFSLITAFFNAMLALSRRSRPPSPANPQVRRYLVAVNVTTAGNWFGFFFAVKYLEPALCATLINAVLLLATMAVAVALLGKRRLSPHELLSGAVLLMAMLAVAGVVFSGQSGRAAVDRDDQWVGVAMSFLCGLSMALNTVVSKKLNTLGVSPSTIMARRFVLLVALSFALVDRDALGSAAMSFPGEILLVAVVGNLLPLFALQHGIRLLDPVTVVFLNGLGPLAHLGVQTVSGLYPFSLASLASIGFSTLAILFGAYSSSRPAPAAGRAPFDKGELHGPGSKLG